MKPGDIIRWQCKRFPHVIHDWVVRGVHLGAVGHESVVEIEGLNLIPARTGEWETHQLMFVPECLLRDLPIIGHRKVELA
jgi:hypothetical protein